VEATGRSCETLIHDMDNMFVADFDDTIENSGAKVKEVGPRSPNMNVFIERWIQSVQQECLDHFIVFGEDHFEYKEKLEPKRILLNDDQRRRLAVKGKILGRKRLEEVGTLFTPDTILRWHRKLVAAKYDYSDRRQKIGRPKLSEEIVQLALRMAKENPTF
jgi:hypothetical protein